MRVIALILSVGCCSYTKGLGLLTRREFLPRQWRPRRDRAPTREYRHCSNATRSLRARSSNACSPPSRISQTALRIAPFSSPPEV